MVQNVADLYTVSSRIESDAQAIFILKDNLVPPVEFLPWCSKPTNEKSH